MKQYKIIGKLDSPLGSLRVELEATARNTSSRVVADKLADELSTYFADYGLEGSVSIHSTVSECEQVILTDETGRIYT